VKEVSNGYKRLTVTNVSPDSKMLMTEKKSTSEVHISDGEESMTEVHKSGAPICVRLRASMKAS
jgi:hypothetical protein